MPTEIRNHAQALGDDTHRRRQEANTLRKESATKCGVPKGSPMQYYKHETQTVMGNSNCKLYHDRFIATD